MVNVRLEAIVSNVDYKGKPLVNELRRRVKNIQEQVRRDYQKTVETWEEKPKFYVTVARGDVIVINAGTDSKLYRGIDQGNPAHIIRPKRARLLKFQKGYTAKTVPGVIGSRDGGFAEGSPDNFAKAVMHRGNKPRKFTLIISERARKRIHAELADAVSEWVATTIGEARTTFSFRKIIFGD